MSRPLLADPKRQSEAAKFHKDVFALYGSACALCGKKGATDAAHVVPRAKLGPLRYADAHLARPACRRCHEEVDTGRKAWPITILRDAIRHHNRIAKIPLRILRASGRSRYSPPATRSSEPGATDRCS